QIARRADCHYRVLKESDDDQTSVSVTRLQGEERVRELARMMGGETAATLRHAQELLDSSPDAAHAKSTTENGTGSSGTPSRKKRTSAAK
ncbi:MAG TPA: hypothetical protein VF719_08200, partial [Abditibacteriaceae bacterium]